MTWIGSVVDVVCLVSGCCVFVCVCGRGLLFFVVSVRVVWDRGVFALGYTFLEEQNHEPCTKETTGKEK